MGFSEQPPSVRWSALTFKGVKLAEVWFKPEGDPSGLVFRVPRSTFDIPGIGQRLTAESLVKTVGIPADEVASWHHGGTDCVATAPLPHPPHESTHLEVRVRLKPPHAAAAETGVDQTAATVEWDELEALWKSVLGVEATVEATRKNVEGARAELEAAARRTLMGDEKVHALSADMANWNRAKSRAHFTLPKANDFIHRATWAATAAERKRLGDIFESPDGVRPALPPGDQLLRELESLRKSRQVLAAQGTSVYQECRAISADVQGALRTLQSNAATRASKKKGGAGGKGMSF